MKSRKKIEAEVPFPLAPMIDLTFLLLIFFMVTSRISKDPLQEPMLLPIASVGTIPGDMNQREFIEIGREGKISIARRSMNLPDIENYLRTRLQSDSTRKIYLRADATLPARKIKKIVAIATELGSANILMGVCQP